MNCLFDNVVVFGISTVNNKLNIVRKMTKKKRPDKLKNLDTSGPNINALKKAAPIAIPTIAIDCSVFLRGTIR